MITAEEARAISNINDENSCIIKSLCNKIQDEASKGRYFIEQDILRTAGNDLLILSVFQGLGYRVEIEQLRDSMASIPLKRIRISWVSE